MRFSRDTNYLGMIIDDNLVYFISSLASDTIQLYTHAFLKILSMKYNKRILRISEHISI